MRDLSSILISYCTRLQPAKLRSQTDLCPTPLYQLMDTNMDATHDGRHECRRWSRSPFGRSTTTDNDVSGLLSSPFFSRQTLSRIMTMTPRIKNLIQQKLTG